MDSLNLPSLLRDTPLLFRIVTSFNVALEVAVVDDVGGVGGVDDTPNAIIVMEEKE
jgi:hypothetical protein